jgi:chromosome segregation ATPase
MAPVRRKTYGRKPTSEEFAAEEVTPPPFDTSDAVAELWSLRKLPEQIDKLGAAVDGYTAQVERHELLIKQWSDAAQECIADIETATRRQASMEGSLDQFFKSEWPHLRTALSDFSAAIRNLGDRMTKLESCVENIGAAQESQVLRITKMDERLALIEREKRDKVIASAERIRIFTFARVGVVAAAGAIGYLVNWLT